MKPFDLLDLHEKSSIYRSNHIIEQIFFPIGCSLKILIIFTSNINCYLLFVISFSIKSYL